ncbi:MAG: hypothetical protein MJ252_16300 [archaeon]|nr:hypothetical protein [archaeon]
MSKIIFVLILFQIMLLKTESKNLRNLDPPECEEDKKFIYHEKCFKECPEGTVAKDNTCEDVIAIEPITDTTKEGFTLYEASSNVDYFYTQIDNVIAFILPKVETNKILSIKGYDYEFLYYDYRLKDTLVNGGYPYVSLDVCENVIKGKYDLNPSSSDPKDQIFIAQINYETGSSTTNLDYFIFKSNGTMMDISRCTEDNSGNKIRKIKNLDKDKIPDNMQEFKEMMDLGYDLYDSDDPFYDDYCLNIVIENKDTTVGIRKQRFSKVESYCENGCQLDQFDLIKLKVICQCTPLQSDYDAFNDLVNKKKKNDVTGMFDSLLSSTNLRFTFCYKQMSPKNFFKMRMGAVISVMMITIEVFTCVYYYCFLMEKIMNNALSEISSDLQNPPKKKYKKKEEGKELMSSKEEFKNNHSSVSSMVEVSQPPEKIKEKSKGKKEKKKVTIKEGDKLRIKGKEPTVLNEDSFTNNIEAEGEPKGGEALVTIKEKSKEEEEGKKEETRKTNLRVITTKSGAAVLVEEMDEMDYLDAIIEDKRTYKEIFLNALISKQILISSFVRGSIFHPLILRISMFLFTIYSFFFFNAIFYTDEDVEERFNSGNENFIQMVWTEMDGKAIYTTLLILLIGKIFSLICDVQKRFLKVKQESNNQDKMVLMKIALDLLKGKMRTYFLFIFGLTVYYTYFLSVFTNIYVKTQKSWIVSSFVSILLNLFIMFVFAVVYSALRVIGITYEIS